MRIALVHSYYSSAQPSGENVVVDLQSTALRRAGHEVEVFSLHSDSMSNSLPQKVGTAVRVTTGRGKNPEAALADFRPDVTHVHNLFPNFGTEWIKRWTGPLVTTVHNYRPVCAAGSLHRNGGDCVECPSTGSWRAVVHRCYRGSVLATIPLAAATRNQGRANPLLQRADRVIFLSERAKRKMGYVYGGDLENRATVLPNFSEAAASTSQGEPRGDYWIYAGRLAPEKGILNLVRYWPANKALVVLGDGPDQADVTAASLGKRIDVIGTVSFERAGALISASRGLIFPSLWEEPAPAMSYIQALAAGVPTLALNQNAVADDIALAGTGVVFDDVTGMVDFVVRGNPGFDAQRANARIRFSEAFSQRSWLERINAIYSDVVSA